jgi:hypothetical protein
MNRYLINNFDVTACVSHALAVCSKKFVPVVVLSCAARAIFNLGFATRFVLTNEKKGFATSSAFATQDQHCVARFQATKHIRRQFTSLQQEGKRWKA